MKMTMPLEVREAREHEGRAANGVCLEGEWS